jgi:hypothetical protein
MNIEDKFSNHVKSVFDEYEDETADQGWAELLKKYPDKQAAAVQPRGSSAMRLWIGGIAASILVACFILFFATEQNKNKEDLTSKKTIAKNGETPVAATENKTEENISEENIAGANTEIIKEVARPLIARQMKPEVGTYSISDHTKPKEITLSVPAVQAADVPKHVVKEPVAQTPIASHVPQNAIASSKKPDSVKKPVAFSEFLANESKAASAKGSAKEKKQIGNTSFDVYAGTFFNYFEDNPAKLNAGFGFNANVKVSKKIYLSLGAGLSENKIAYENSLPRGALDAFTSSFPLNSSNELSGAVNSPTGGNGPAGPNGATGATGANGTPNISFTSRTSGPSTDVKINATLINLDIPIALKFYAGKGERFYFLTGVNSNSYINQKYMQTYSTFNYLSQTTENNEQEVEGSKLSGFDFASSAIFAIGINQDLGKKNTLTFEPFYRPSLRGLGDKNIRLNTIGINLKLNLKNQ